MRIKILVLIPFIVGLALAVMPGSNEQYQLIPDETRILQMQGSMRVDETGQIPRTLFQLAYTVHSAAPEEMAYQYLIDNRDLLHIQDPRSELKPYFILETPGGYRVRFHQTILGLPVFNADVVVSLNLNSQVVFVVNDYQQDIKLSSPQPETSAAAALSGALTYLNINDGLEPALQELVVYAGKTRSRLAWRTMLLSHSETSGDWEVLTDAHNGEIFRVEDQRAYDEYRINGFATVFDPDPVTRAQTVYGNDGFEDNNDNIHPDLTAQLVPVQLRDITYNSGSGLYLLEGPYAEIVDYEGPYNGLFSQDSDDFSVNRDDDLFEAANIYHHIDQSMRYINDQLGFDVMPYQYGGGVRFDPQGLNGDLNAHYTWDGYVAFGSPSNWVDLGEDHAVVLHELGHGIHDWITGGGLSQTDGLSEGCGDFWAQSYTRGLGFFEPNDEQYDWFSVWGFNPYLRVTDFSGHYPEALNGEVHYDGQLWSSSLMSIFDLIGKPITDMDFLEGMSMTGGNSDQVDAALAFIQADENLFDGENLSLITPVFVDRGYIEATLTADFSVAATGGTAPFTVQFNDGSLSMLDPIQTWGWDLDGDGEIDSSDENPTWVYESPGLYTVTLIVDNGDSQESGTKVDFISVNEGIFVWNGPTGGNGHSGELIRDHLQAFGYFPALSQAVTLPSTLIGYEAAFLSLGNSGDDSITRFNDELALIVKDYLMAGGRLYLDGGEPLGWDQRDDDYGLFVLFGLEDTDDGDDNIIDALNGTDGTFTEGMTFTGSSQQYNLWIDTFTPDESGLVIFDEQGYGIVGVQNEGSYGQKTVCFSYNLADLNDGEFPGTRENLLNQITTFFDLSEAMAGDMNEDGVLNVLDIMITVNFIISQGEPSYYQNLVGDMNHDGILNILDVVAMVNAIVGS